MDGYLGRRPTTTRSRTGLVHPSSRGSGVENRDKGPGGKSSRGPRVSHESVRGMSQFVTNGGEDLCLFDCTFCVSLRVP